MRKQKKKKRDAKQRYGRRKKGNGEQKKIILFEDQEAFQIGLRAVKINRKIYTPGTKAREMYVQGMILHELNIYFEFLFLMSIYSHLKAFIKIVV